MSIPKMSPAEARRVARYHASSVGCTRFGAYSHGRFRDDVWRGHFDYDRRMTERRPVRNEGEVDAIVAFLLSGEPAPTPEPAP